MKFTIPFLFAAFASPVLGDLSTVCDENPTDPLVRKKLQIRIDCTLPNGNSCLNKTEVVAYHQELNQKSECECQWYQIDLWYKLFNRFQTATDNVYKKGENMQIAYGVKQAFCVKAGDDVLLTNNQEEGCKTYNPSNTVNGFAGLGQNDAYEFEADTAKFVEHSMMVNTCYNETMGFDLKAKFGLKWAKNKKQKQTCERSVRAKFPTEIPGFDSCPVAPEIIISEKPAVTMPGKGPKSPGKGTKAPGNTAPGKGTKAPGNTAPGKGTKAPGSAVRRRRNLA